MNSTEPSVQYYFDSGKWFKSHSLKKKIQIYKHNVAYFINVISFEHVTNALK